MVCESPRRLPCSLTREYSSSISIGATIIHPTHRFYRTFTKICLTFLPLTSRLCSPTAGSLGEGIYTKSTLHTNGHEGLVDRAPAIRRRACLKTRTRPLT